ncbi:MAG TPA: amylo-alpha-1,6-glucosidase [Tetrasphaera sp.]|nr:amylo-alpha-1,6-glucosidase [Tetrasphaera sp.]
MSAPAVVAVGETLEWADRRHRTSVRTSPAADLAVADEPASTAYLTWVVDLAQGVPVTLRAEVRADRTAASLFDADPGAPLVDWSGVSMRAGDQRLAKLVAGGLADLRCLLLTDPQEPRDVFPAAGTPWYLTLFGRDSIWAARMLLPVDVEVAAGTLRTLARRQGRQDDPETAEEPGKILHEVRRTVFVDSDHGMELPPVYYGTVDATALWVVLLHDAWRAGMPQDQVRALLPNLQAAVAWIQAAADNETGLLRYLDTTGHGLSNQGWKDSGDSMRRRDGSIAPAPIALVEAQAYAVEAAADAAHLYDAFGLTGGEDVRAWGKTLAERLRERYWVSDERGSYLAMAIDGQGQPVDGVGSNMGHVLGTGALTDDEVETTIARLNSPDLLGEFGIGTLGRGNPAYNPIGYHTGSVWTHDSAIALLGMVREGRGADGVAIARGLVDCGAALGYRVPELYAGESAAGAPAPYPASCRPQAWAAASAVALVSAVLGLVVDVPGRRIALSPMRPAPFGPVTVTGLRFGATRFTVEVDATGNVGVSGLPVDVEVDIR